MVSQRPRIEPGRSVRERPCAPTPALGEPALVDGIGAQEMRRLALSEQRNRQLDARVHGLEAALERSAAELVRLRGELRSARRDSLSDPLTGLANRRSFDLRLAAAAGRRGISPGHLLLADIDHFKGINDAYGHGVGDQILCIVGGVLRANLRRDGMVARLGGDEFGLLLDAAATRAAAVIADRLCARIAARPLVLRDRTELTPRITVSIGVAGWQPDLTPVAWLVRADAALYRAKCRGRNQVAFDSGRPVTAPSLADRRPAKAAVLRRVITLSRRRPA